MFPQIYLKVVLQSETFNSDKYGKKQKKQRRSEGVGQYFLTALQCARIQQHDWFTPSLLLEMIVP